jgi:hypothetical protein
MKQAKMIAGCSEVAVDERPFRMAHQSFALESGELLVYRPRFGRIIWK